MKYYSGSPSEETKYLRIEPDKKDKCSYSSDEKSISSKKW